MYVDKKPGDPLEQLRAAGPVFHGISHNDPAPPAALVRGRHVVYVITGWAMSFVLGGVIPPVFRILSNYKVLAAMAGPSVLKVDWNKVPECYQNAIDKEGFCEVWLKNVVSAPGVQVRAGGQPAAVRVKPLRRESANEVAAG